MLFHDIVIALKTGSINTARPPSSWVRFMRMAVAVLVVNDDHSPGMIGQGRARN